MESKQIKSLKLNVTNIQSSLLGYNKQLRKLRIEKRNIIQNEEKQKIVKEKESKIESPIGKISSTINNIGMRVLSGPMSIFDKIKEFFGIILLGILINNLPAIISKLKKFFGNNPWIIKAVKTTFDILGKGFMGLINLVENAPSFLGGTYDQIKKTTETISKEIGNLMVFFGVMDTDLTTLLGAWQSATATRTPAPATPRPTVNAQRFAQSGGYGRYAPPSQPQPQSNPLRPSREAAPTVIPRPTPEETRGYAKGGTVKPVSNSRKQQLGTSGKPAETKTTVAPTFARPGGTAKGRKAAQAVNYFKYFENNVEIGENVARVGQENNNVFQQVIKKLEEIRILRLRVKDDEGGGGGGGPVPPGGGPGGGGGLSSAEVFEGKGADRVWNFFKGMGLSDIAVSGIMGNAQRESGFDPTIRGEGMGPGDTDAIGLFQWGEKARWASLVAWAKKNKLDPWNLDTQLKWSAVELNGPYKSVIPALQNAKSPSEAAESWRAIYEGSIGTGEDITSRQQFAEAWYKKNKGKVPLAVRKASQANLPALPPTNTLSGQEYGADRDDNNDGIPDRKHAGVDFDISGNEKFYSRLGGEVIKVGVQGTPPNGYGNYVDIYNKDLDLTERIAEGNTVLVKQGDTIVPGTPVAQGESGSGVIHYEIRKGRGGMGFSGTLNPIATLTQLGLKRQTGTGKGKVKTSPVARPNLEPITNIINMMKSMGVNKIDVGGYRLYRDKTKLKVEDKDGGFLGLFGSDMNIEKVNLQLLKKLENDIKYIRNVNQVKLEGGNAQIKPLVKKDENLIASIMTEDPSEEPVTNTIIMPIQTIVEKTNTALVAYSVNSSGGSVKSSSPARRLLIQSRELVG